MKRFTISIHISITFISRGILETIITMKQSSESGNRKFYNSKTASLAERYESADVSDLHERLAGCLQRYCPANRFHPAIKFHPVMEFCPENRCLKAGPKVLELGCGSGRDASFMLSLGYDVLATDACKEMVRHAVVLHPELSERTMVLDLNNPLPMGNQSVDCAVSIAMLMHLEKSRLESAIAEISRVLKDDGLFICSVCVKRDDIDSHGFTADGRYFNIMTASEWMNLMKASRMRIIEFSQQGDGLNRPGINWLNVIALKNGPIFW